MPDFGFLYSVLNSIACAGSMLYRTERHVTLEASSKTGFSRDCCISKDGMMPQDDSPTRHNAY